MCLLSKTAATTNHGLTRQQREKWRLCVFWCDLSANLKAHVLKVNCLFTEVQQHREEFINQAGCNEWLQGRWFGLLIQHNKKWLPLKALEDSVIDLEMGFIVFWISSWNGSLLFPRKVCWTHYATSTLDPTFRLFEIILNGLQNNPKWLFRPKLEWNWQIK